MGRSLQKYFHAPSVAGISSCRIVDLSSQADAFQSSHLVQDTTHPRSLQGLQRQHRWPQQCRTWGQPGCHPQAQHVHKASSWLPALMSQGGTPRDWFSQKLFSQESSLTCSKGILACSERRFPLCPSTSKALTKAWALFQRRPANLSLPTACFQPGALSGKAHELGFPHSSNISELLSGFACAGESPHLILH